MAGFGLVPSGKGNRQKKKKKRFMHTVWHEFTSLSKGSQRAYAAFESHSDRVSSFRQRGD